MNYLIPILFLLFLPSICSAQNFTPLATGAIVNTASDSRSVNIIDVNGDGWEDVFISNGLGSGQKEFLYLNDANGNFTTGSGGDLVDDALPSVGAAAADFDNDGDIDIYVTNWHGKKNKFYTNDGTGNFSSDANVTTANSTYSEAASWGDFDNDGLLDLLVTNSDGNPKANNLYRNMGAVNFQRQNMNPLTTANNTSRNVNWVDYDNDQDMDLYITNEGSQRNELYANDGLGNFTKINEDVLINAAFGTMTSSWGDIDNDGDLDLFLGNSGFFVASPNYLFRNRGDGNFEKIEEGAFIANSGCNYGSSFGDVDNDGDLDLLVTNGFCAPEKLKDVLYLNDGQGVFQEVENALPGHDAIASYGTAMGDLNNDGFLDVVIAHCKNNTAAPQPVNAVYINDTNANHWIKVRLEGSLSNRSAIGARVFVFYEKNGETVRQMREVNTQSGYSGQNSLYSHFGLGQAAKIDSLLVHWPSGKRTRLLQPEIDQTLFLKEELVNSIKENENQNQVAVFPNPIAKRKDRLMISLIDFEQDAAIIDLSVRAMDGRIVYNDSLKTKLKEHQLDWPNSSTSSGVYSLWLKFDNRPMQIQKIIVE